VWGLVDRQHGVVSWWQLRELGWSRRAIQHRVATGRLHPVRRGAYAVGRPKLDRRGDLMAAVLACGRGAALSHGSAAALWGVCPDRSGPVDVSSPSLADRCQPGVRVHRRRCLRSADVTSLEGIPLTVPVLTLIDLAAVLGPWDVERAVNEADRLSLVDPEGLRTALLQYRGRRGVARLRDLLDSRTFRLTDSELERRFLRLVDAAGLKTPRTGQRLNGFKVDFFWPELGLVVETDGLRYHRTPAQQARDRVRDQAHTAAGLTTLRFTHAQVRHEANRVRSTLLAVARRLEVGRAA
jgi:very-short-patch-repair endonuclease